MPPHLRLKPSTALKIVGLLVLYLVGLSLLPSSASELRLLGGTAPHYNTGR